MTTKSYVANENEYELEKAKKKPYGHKEYQRTTPTGKIAKVPAKGVKLSAKLPKVVAKQDGQSWVRGDKPLEYNEISLPSDILSRSQERALLKHGAKVMGVGMGSHEFGFRGKTKAEIRSIIKQVFGKDAREVAIDEGLDNPNDEAADFEMQNAWKKMSKEERKKLLVSTGTDTSYASHDYLFDMSGSALDVIQEVIAEQHKNEDWAEPYIKKESK